MSDDYKWLEFAPNGVSASGKTKEWQVTSKRGMPLGRIKWFSAWRCYTIHTNDTIFNAECLRDVADFCEKRTKEHKERK